MAQDNGIIAYVSDRGWFFAEREGDSAAIFIHQRNVENRRFLKLDDRVAFDVAPSKTHPGQTEGINVRYLGHVIARQIGPQAATDERA